MLCIKIQLFSLYTLYSLLCIKIQLISLYTFILFALYRNITDISVHHIYYLLSMEIQLISLYLYTLCSLYRDTTDICVKLYVECIYSLLSLEINLNFKIPVLKSRGSLSRADYGIYVYVIVP